MKKTQNVREGTRKGASRRKKELALALCVSLWMAGGSVAGALGAIYINENETLVVSPGAPTTYTHSGKTLTVTGGDWPGWKIYGGNSMTATVPLDSYRLTLSNVNNIKDIYGVYTLKGDATNNDVTAANCTGTGSIVGGESANGNATGNLSH